MISTALMGSATRSARSGMRLTSAMNSAGRPTFTTRRSIWPACGGCSQPQPPRHEAGDEETDQQDDLEICRHRGQWHSKSSAPTGLQKSFHLPLVRK